jgi:hypothetical protein
MYQAELLHAGRRQLGAGLERSDGRVLRAVVLENAAEVGQEGDEEDVADEDRHTNQSLDDDELPGRLDREPVREQRWPDLEEHEREADSKREREDDLAPADLSLDVAVLVALLRATFAEMARALKPMASDSPSAITPRMTGSRQIRRRFIGDSMSCTTSSMSPSGVRTATAQLDGLRIITPSSTAWPPYEIFMRALAAAGAAGLLEATLEALHPAARVHELLLPRVEGVALRADLHVQLGLRGAGPELVAA